jgi:hypothetical protein
MRLATIRIAGRTRAVRAEDGVVVQVGARGVGALFGQEQWHQPLLPFPANLRSLQKENPWHSNGNKEECRIARQGGYAEEESCGKQVRVVSALDEAKKEP